MDRVRNEVRRRNGVTTVDWSSGAVCVEVAWREQRTSW